MPLPDALHYTDCACSEGLTCAARFRLETRGNGPGLLGAAIALGWTCPGVDAEHWPEKAHREGARLVVTCGHCGMESSIGPLE